MNAYESFVHPDPMYRGTDFWMLNDRLEEGEIRRQLHEMKEQGVYSFIARTYIGLKSDYPREDFQSKLRVIVDTAKALEMKVFLQAGYMPECVLDLPEEYSLNYIKVYRGSDVEIGVGEPVLCRRGELVFTEYCSRTYLDMFNHDSVAFYLKQSYENVWRDFSKDFGDPICSIWVDEPSYSAEYLPYPRGVEERFFARYGYSLKEEIYKLYVDDEGYRTVRYHYRKLLQDMLEEHYFSMLRQWCKERGLMASGHLMLEDTLYSQISRACAVMPYYKYFDLPGIDLLCGQMNWRRGEVKPGNHRYQDPDWRYRSIETTTPIQCASAARQMGAEHILCEMYGVTTQDMTFRNQKYQFDYMVAHGINHRAVHGIFYSLHGRAKRLYPPHVNYYQPYWKDLHVLYDYVASTSRFVSLGQPDGDVLVLHPLDSAYCEFVSREHEALTGVQPSALALKQRDEQFHDLLVKLSFAHVVFDLGDERTIEQMGSVLGDRFVVGKMSYRTVVLPRMLEIGKGTLEKLHAFAEAGGRVIVLGDAPTLLDGFETEGDLLNGLPHVEYVTADHELVERVRNPYYSYEGNYDRENLFIRRRTEGKDAYYFLFNADCSAEQRGTLRIAGEVQAELWNGFSKAVTSVPCRRVGKATEIELTVPEGGSLMLHTVEGEAAPEIAAKPVGEGSISLSDGWVVERKDPNVLLLEFCAFAREGEEYGEEYPVLAVHQMLVEEGYRGELRQKYTFHTDRSLCGLSLALEDAADHRILFNGQEVSSTPVGYYMAKSFETLPLPPAKKGENVLELIRPYQPLDAMRSKLSSLFETQKGVELESAYLIGDFGVEVVAEPCRNGNLRYARHMVLTAESGMTLGELTLSGYPFYAGSMNLTQRICLPFDPKERAEVLFALDELNGCLAHVLVNGVDCGMLHSAPYRLSVSSALRKGENEITLSLRNTLRNLLGPYHRPVGEEGSYQGGYGVPGVAWTGIGGGDREWYRHRQIDTKVWSDSYMQIPQGVRGAKLLFPLD